MENEYGKMYTKLLRLPLLQGASCGQISQLIEKLPFHFIKYTNGQSIITSGEDSTHLKFVVSGSAKIVLTNRCTGVSLSQIVSAPCVVGPDFLFGREPVYPFDVYAHGDCGIMQLSKADYIKVVSSDQVFLFNILNYLSRNAQKPKLSLQHLPQGTIAERLAFVISMLTNKDSSDISLHFKQKDLCVLLGTRRASLVAALECLKSQGMIQHTNNEIRITDRDALVSLIHERVE